MNTAKTIEEYLDSQPDWRPELDALLAMLRGTTMAESLKWGVPVFTVNKKNVAGIAAFKNYVGLWFHQGALLEDPYGKLINAQEGRTEALRQWRFQNLGEILANEEYIRAYLQEAIINQEQGREIKPKKRPLIIPEALQQVLDENAELAARFEALNLTRKREYVEHIDIAKREETKQKRLDKIIPMILEGIGLNDKYRR